MPGSIFSHHIECVLVCCIAEMVSPLDLKKACLSFDQLGLPLRLRNLKSGVTVVESAMASDEQVDERMKDVVAGRGEQTFGMFWQGRPWCQHVMHGTPHRNAGVGCLTDCWH